MNNGGSTLLHHYLSNCKSVVPLPKTNKHATSSEGHNHAGKAIPHPRNYGVLGLWTEKPNLISNDKNYNWKIIKQKWFKAWERSAGRPLKNMILLEKSPPNVIRAELLQKYFLNSYFIVMVRNPYALSEGLRRRQGYKIERCATHWGESMKFQMRNLKILDNVIWVKYSDLCDNQEMVKTKITTLLPELNDFSFEGKLSGHHSLHGKKEMPIKNLNPDQIKNLGTNDIRRINNILSKYQKELDYFGYKRM